MRNVENNCKNNNCELKIAGVSVNLTKNEIDKLLTQLMEVKCYQEVKEELLKNKITVEELYIEKITNIYVDLLKNETKARHKCLVKAINTLDSEWVW